VATVAILFFFGIPANIYSTTYWAALVSLVALFCAWLTRRGRADLGLGLLIGAIQLGILIPSIENGGLAIAFVVISLITTFSLSQLMKSSRLATIASLISIAIATLLLYLDLFEPFKRIPNQNITATWIIAGGVILVYALIILRRFPSYSLRNKFLVAFVGVTVVVTGVLAMFYYSSTTNNLRSGLENELKQHSDSIASRISDLFNEQINILTHYHSTKFCSRRSKNPMLLIKVILPLSRPPSPLGKRSGSPRLPPITMPIPS
jgi:hypothetical protein